MQTLQSLTLSEFREALSKCSGLRVSIDTETTGVYWWRDHVTTVGFHCPEAGIEGTCDIDTAVEDPTDDYVVGFDRDVTAIVREVLAPDTTVIMHNAKFDMSMLNVDPNTYGNGWKVRDTAVMVHLNDSRMFKSLENSERQLLGTNSKRNHIEEAPKGKNRKKVWMWPPHIRVDYCLNDCRVTYQLYEFLTPVLKKMGLAELFLKDMQYLMQLYFTEHLGITLDIAHAANAQQSLLRHQKELEQQLFDAVGYVFNWRSNKQLSKAIYEDMGIEKPKDPFASKAGDKASSYKNRFGFERVKALKGGMYNDTCTSTFLLMEKVHHPLGELIAALREASKLAKTISLWMSLVDEEGLIHTNFNLTGTRTGRLSSSKPNLANVASDTRSRFTQGLFSGGVERTEEYNLRNSFRARPGHYMLSIDYRQMEMRFFGVDSQDENLLDFLRSGQDIHLMIAKKVWGDCGPHDNKIHREWSKTIAFGLIYGMTTGSLEHKLGMTRQQATQVIEDYWGAFPRIRPWLFETILTCKSQGYLRYWSGRIWREETEMFMYKGANAKVQGGCADLLSIAALRTHKWLHGQGRYIGNIVSYIYDELLMEITKKEIELAANSVAKIMQVPDLLDMPFLTDCKVGTTYGDMVEMQLEDGTWKMPSKLQEH